MDVYLIVILKLGGILLLFFLNIWMVRHALQEDKSINPKEASRIIIINLAVFMTILNGYRNTEWLLFSDGTFGFLLGSLLLIGGIDISKLKNLFNGNKGKNSKDSENL